MVKIRLVRMGTKHKPFFRIVVVDSKEKRNGKAIEKIGFYDPKTKPFTLKINQKRLDYWLSVGAQMNPVLKKLLKNEKNSSITG